jgi:hypothetical protein
MPEPLDAYADQFQVVLGPFGCTLNFLVTDATPASPGSVPQPTRIASIRMSMEHLKSIAFLVARQVKQVERTTGVRAEVSIQILNQMQISPEDWNDFWRLG